MTYPPPNRDDIKTFMHVLFSSCSGYIPCRSFAEKGGCSAKPHNIWFKADDAMVDKSYKFADQALKRKMGCFVIPGTVNKPGQAGSSDIAEMQTLLIDIDEGDTEEKLNILTKALGQPTLIIESGGITKEGNTKLHVYWQLVHSVTGNELQQLIQMRHHIALSVGGDTHFKSAHQPIRVAGSVYQKGDACKLVKIRIYEPIEYELEELMDACSNLPGLAAPDNLPGLITPFIQVDNSSIPIDRIMTSKVHAGGNGEYSRFSNLQRIIGFWLRRYHEGNVSKDQAWQEIIDYNSANVIPPWSEDRLRQMAGGLWKKHINENGKVEEKEKIIIESINPLLWRGAPPERQWLIEDWLPRGYVTALYGDGGIGKTLLAQQLITALAIGHEFLNSKSAPYKIYALMCEDDTNELWRRQVAINEHYSITMQDIANIRYVSRVGHDNLLMTFTKEDTGKLTKFFGSLLLDILEFKPDLVLLDTAADLFGGNENNRPQVRQFIQVACGQIARSTNSAVLLCAHPSEAGMQKGTGSGGSTAWNNTVRSRWYLKRPENGELTASHRILSRVKSNYSAAGEDKYFKWEKGVFNKIDSTGYSTPVTGKVQSKRNTAERDRKTQLMLRFIDMEAAEGRVYTMNQFAEKFEDNDHNTYGFGSRRSINDRLSIAATQGIIKFFNDPGKYGLAISKSRYGYLCGDSTMLTMQEAINIETGEVDANLIQIKPTHYKCPLNGALLPIKNRQNNGDVYE